MDKGAYIINEDIISLPPYLSTSWKNVRALHSKGSQLIFALYDGEDVALPNLSDSVKQEIFQAHVRFLEESVKKTTKDKENPFPFKLPPFLSEQMLQGDGWKVGLFSKDFGQMLQHNVEHKNAPDLPQEMLGKIAEMMQGMLPEDPDLLPKAEPHCNCPHCQIARAFAKSDQKEQLDSIEQQEEEIAPEDLSFCQYTISECGPKLYQVQDKLNPEEIYTVYLGTPMGCTCGKEGCEHIVAVLRS